jgi:hypothetical protein
MSTVNPTGNNGDETDPLIDEVRAIRRSVCDLFEGDVERLADHLRGIEEEFRGRTGRFAHIPVKPGPELFPDALHAEPDPFLSDLRKLRKA